MIYNNDFIGRRNANNIMKSFQQDSFQLPSLDELRKGGVGSGRKIGATQSGKDIYDHFDHPEHKKFGLVDHKNAVTAHAGIAAKLMNKDKKDRTKEEKVALEHHGKQVKLHFQASKGD